MKVFNSGVFTGAAVLAEKENLDSLRAYAPVVRAWHSTRVMLEPGTELKSFSQDATAVNYSIHGMTGVDKLHSQGILGKGVTVAVVDTGVDYTHPAVSIRFALEIQNFADCSSLEEELGLPSRSLAVMTLLAMAVSGIGI